MAKQDKRIDDYIDKAEAFARPVLNHLRAVVHEVCPEIQETVKWGCPHFEYAGGILCSMAAFKKHCVFGFWLGSMMKDPLKLLSAVGERSAMGHFGKLTSIADLPSKKILATFIRQAMELNEKGVKRPKADTSSEERALVVPDYFLAVLKKNKKAATVFENFSYSHKKEYVEWIAEAKTEGTRNKRIATALDWLAEGKGRNWKYTKL